MHRTPTGTQKPGTKNNTKRKAKNAELWDLTVFNFSLLIFLPPNLAIYDFDVKLYVELGKMNRRSQLFTGLAVTDSQNHLSNYSCFW